MTSPSANPPQPYLVACQYGPQRYTILSLAHNGYAAARQAKELGHIVTFGSAGVPITEKLDLERMAALGRPRVMQFDENYRIPYKSRHAKAQKAASAPKPLGKLPPETP